MEFTVAETKAALRRQVLSALATLQEKNRAIASTQACALLQRQRVWQEARAVLLFAPLPGELDIWPLAGAALAQGKQIALPKYVSERGAYVACQVENLTVDVAPGHLGIREPHSRCRLFPLNRLDFTLVPGIAFDLDGRRLGRGRGFYDRLLASIGGSRCGVAFDEQIVRRVPVEPHDVYLNCILTPTRWIEL